MSLELRSPRMENKETQLIKQRSIAVDGSRPTALRRRTAGIAALVAAVILTTSGCTSPDDEHAPVRAAVQQFLELSSDDEAAALALTTLEPSSATSCLSQSTWLRFAEVGEIRVDGDSARAELKATTVADPASVVVDVQRTAAGWRLDLGYSMLVTVAVSPAQVPSQIQVGTCTAEVINGLATVVLPPGEFTVRANDPTGVVETGLKEKFGAHVQLPGTQDVSFDLAQAPLSNRSLLAIDKAIEASEQMCASLVFNGPACPPGAVGAVSSEGPRGLNWDAGVDHKVVDGTWIFTTAPHYVRYGFEGEDSWTKVSAMYTGTLVGGGQDGKVTANVMDVTSPD